MAQHSRRPWSGIGYVGDKLESSVSAARYVLSQITVENALLLASAALLSQAVLPGGAMPFCVPLVGALLLLDRAASAALLGCALGLLLRWEPIAWYNGWQLAAGALLLFVVRRGYGWKVWKVSVAVAASMLLPLPFVARRLDTLLICLSGAVAAAVLIPVYTRALLALDRRERALSYDDKLCCLLLLCVLCLGGMAWRVGVVSLGLSLCALCVFAVAYAAGPGMALPAGALLGLSLMAAGSSFDMLCLLTLCGALAGALRGSGRFLPCLGGVLGCALAAAAQGGLPWMLEALPSLAIGALAFLLVPARWLDSLHGLLEPPRVALPETGSVAASQVLVGYARAMADMARALPAHDATADTPLPVELLACRLCSGCECQQSCWDARREESMRLLDGLLSACADGVSREDMEQAALRHGCRRAQEAPALAEGLAAQRMRREREEAQRMEARAWALEHLCGQARALKQMAERLGEDYEAAQARQAILAAMPALRGRPEALCVCRLDGRLHIWLDVEYDGRAVRLESALSTALGARMELLEPGAPEERLLFVQRPRLALQVGCATAPIEGESLCGDSVLHQRLDASRALLALSDGMGSGAAARAESRSALSLLEGALRAGYARQDALRTVNGLLMACRGDEMYATMDLCVIDLDSGEAAFEKLGACPSFILRAGKCRRIGGDALPLGIVDAVRPRALAARLLPGDMLLMVSDGITDAFGGEDGPLLRALGGLAPPGGTAEPQQLAQTLLRRALERAGGAALDDMTVLAATVREAC